MAKIDNVYKNPYPERVLEQYLIKDIIGKEETVVKRDISLADK